MEQQDFKSPELKELETIELVGITFIRDYIQFLFDGPLLNTYTLPSIIFQNKTLTSKDFGYYDALCSLIGKSIIFTNVDETHERIEIFFENEVQIFVSLKDEDRECAEAAMLRIETGGIWKIW